MESFHPNKASQDFIDVCIVTGVLTLLSTICVAFRFISQHRKRDLWWDDWTILASLGFSIGLFVNTILVTMPSLGGSGYHIDTYAMTQLNTWSKVRDIDSRQTFNADQLSNDYFLPALPFWRSLIQLLHPLISDIDAVILSTSFLC